jgi:hypothetical protein
MCTVLVTYNPSNKIAQGLMEVLAMTKGVEIMENAMLGKVETRKPLPKMEGRELVDDPFNLN